MDAGCRQPDWVSEDGTVRLFNADSQDLSFLPDESVDSIVCDPPYELGFMGKAWDSTGIAYNVDMWRECYRVLKPGGHLLSFGGTRTYHRMACAIEDAGFEVRDQIQWVYGSGFPKSLDVSKAIDKAAGVEREELYLSPNRRPGHEQGKSWKQASPESMNYHITAPATDSAKQWQGWGTALKPAHEPICMARKPLIGTVAENVQRYGTGAINVDGCRVNRLHGDRSEYGRSNTLPHANTTTSLGKFNEVTPYEIHAAGRWPANFIHDGSDEVVREFPITTSGKPNGCTRNITGFATAIEHGTPLTGFGDSGSAARFFYCAKASKSERRDSKHPTIKPLALMRYLVRLVTPPNGTVLDPFCGSGTTIEAAHLEGFCAIGIDKDRQSIDDTIARMPKEPQALFAGAA